MNDSPLTELQELWRQQDAEPSDLSLEAIRLQSAILERRGKRAMLDAALIFIFLAAGFIGLMVLFHNPLLRVGATLTSVAFGLIALQTRTMRLKERAAAEHTAENGLQSTISFYRSQLERRCERHRGLPFWSRWLVLLPGPITFFLGFAQARPDLRPMILFELLTFLIAMAAAIPLNRRASRNCESRLEALDRLYEA